MRHYVGPAMIATMEQHKMWTGSIVSVAPKETSHIMTNNLSVSFMAFAGGILFGVGTFVLLLNNGMMLFKPAALDSRTLQSLAQTETEAAACFCLVDDPSIRLRRGRPLEFAQLALLIRDEESSSS